MTTTSTSDASSVTPEATPGSKPKRVKPKKTSEIPTRVYSYRCLPPTDPADVLLVEDQFRLAAAYRNSLVEIEHRMRDRFRAIQLAHPAIGPALRALDEARTGWEAAIAAVRAAKSGGGTPSPEILAALRIAKDLLQASSAVFNTAKKSSADEGDLVAVYQEARKAAHAEQLAARGDYIDRGLRHGTYCRVEDAVRRAASSTKRPLRFERYDGSGSIGTQLIGNTEIRGLPLSDLLAGTDRRIRIGGPGATDKHPRSEVDRCDSWREAFLLPRNLRRHAARTWIDLRLGSQPDRSPRFARFRLTLHRLPPPDAVIKWAYIVRYRVGPRLEWRFQLTLESPAFETPRQPLGTGACALNLGWRRLFDDEGNVLGLRVAYLVDDAGREREIRVPDYIPSSGGRTYPVLSAIGKLDDLARIRSKELERAQSALVAWFAGRKGVPVEWSEPEASTPMTTRTPTTTAAPERRTTHSMADLLSGYATWKSARKMHRLIWAWGQRRVANDSGIYDALVAWVTQDRHLETWQACQRDRLIAHRRETYRVIATELARTYATIVVGKSRLVDIEGWERPAPEDGDPSDGKIQRRMARICAPGEFLEEVRRAADKTGAQVQKGNDVKATRTCAHCGCDDPWDARPQIMHLCPKCGRQRDQDANYGHNLLIREGFLPPIGKATPGPRCAIR